MRLTCPNCDAQYEVDDRAIPEGGRDVQCSNCGHAWFQLPARPEERGEDEAAAFAPHAEAPHAPPGERPEGTDVADGVADQVSTRTAPQAPAASDAAIPEPGFSEPLGSETAPAEATAPDPTRPRPAEPQLRGPALPRDEAPSDPAGQPPIDDAGPALGAPAVPQPPEEDDEDGYGASSAASRLSPSARRRELDASILSVLREEAEREKHARRAEGIEVQPDLGLSEPAASSGLARERIDRLRAAGDDANQRPALEEADPAPPPEQPVEAGSGAAPSGPRRDLLPDIEEINSTLRSSSERGRSEPGGDDAAARPASRRRGFRLGFGFALIVVAAMMATYSSAPRIKAHLPAAATVVDDYVRAVDSGRAWLNRALISAVEAINRKNGTEEQ